jgi:hypothetical protein
VTVPLRDVPRGVRPAVCLSFRLRGYAGFLFGIVECFVRVVAGSLRDHTAHMNSLLFQTALSSCDCSLTAVCADARLREQLLPATATHCQISHIAPSVLRQDVCDITRAELEGGWDG